MSGMLTAPTIPPKGGEPDLLAPVDRRVLAVAGASFVALMAVSGLYGFHRDELYFLDAGRHLQGGYVDQPILTPLLARLSSSLFGVWLPGLRLWPSLAVAATVVIGGLLARELGGGRRAQLLAAIGTATMPAVLGAGHLLGPTAFDILAWAALALVVVRIGRTGNLRLWLVGGLVLGLGLANKHSVGFFAVAIFVGALLSGGRRLVLNRWFLAGAAIAACFTVPDVWWQAQHDWPTVAMTSRLNQENGGAGNIVSWVVGQVLMVSIALAWVWVLGLSHLWRSGRPLWRALVWAYGLLFVFFALTTGAKVYYLAGAYVYLLAAGAVHVEEWLAAHPQRLGRLLGWTALSTAVALPLVLPVLPARDIGWTYQVNQVPAETVGWPELVHSVAGAWHSLPAEQRAHAVIFTGDYGEAGAINELGRSAGLPTAVSGHNNEWFWGPGNPNSTTVVAVAPGPLDVTRYGTYLSRFFQHVRVVVTLSNTAGLHNQEWGGHIYVCTGPRHPWGSMWLALRHYD
ncbi:MAG TPA: glycosyltransferase family 39 protein [Acidimicrobiales bacterium]|nr:glycosyltransferase family 39 protein [Acidimicrobiales bacterium]